MCWLTLAIAVASIAFSLVSAREGTTDDLEKFVRELPRGTLAIPFQWFEKDGLLGWEKMILIFGYADNQSLCEAMLVIAAKDSPDQNFRCSAAN